jgi:hypothetical protein
MTENANEAALTAAVEKALETGYNATVAMQLEGYSGYSNDEERATAGRAAFRLLLTRQRERERRLVDELIYIQKYCAEADDSYTSNYIAMRVEALLTALGGGGESGVGE